MLWNHVLCLNPHFPQLFFWILSLHFLFWGFLLKNFSYTILVSFPLLLSFNFLLLFDFLQLVPIFPFTTPLRGSFVLPAPLRPYRPILCLIPFYPPTFVLTISSLVFLSSVPLSSSFACTVSHIKYECCFGISPLWLPDQLIEKEWIWDELSVCVSQSPILSCSLSSEDIPHTVTLLCYSWHSPLIALCPHISSSLLNLPLLSLSYSLPF